MIKIMFVCHGNICRSPMAEFLMKDLVKKVGEENEFLIASSATSSEEVGSPVHYGTKRILDALNISCAGKRAVKLTAADYEKYDYFVGMDSANIKNMQRIFGGDIENKISSLMSYAGIDRDVSDPYWTGDFKETYNDISKGVKAFFKFLKNFQKKY